MKISNIFIKYNEDEKSNVKAFVNICFNQSLIIKNIIVLYNSLSDKYNVVMPSKKSDDGEIRALVFEETIGFREYLSSSILNEFKEGKREFKSSEVMQIPESKITNFVIMEDEGIVARCSVRFDDVLTVPGILIIKNKDKQPIIVYPFRTGKDNEREQLIIPVKAELKDKIEKMILEEYEIRKNYYQYEEIGYPRFRIYYPQNLGLMQKVSPTVLEIKKENKQIMRIMIAKCESKIDFLEGAQNWINKNIEANKMEIVNSKEEMYKDNLIKVYELKYLEKPNAPTKIYKMLFINNLRITFSGWNKDEKINIINETIKNLKFIKEE